MEWTVVGVGGVVLLLAFIYGIRRENAERARLAAAATRRAALQADEDASATTKVGGMLPIMEQGLFEVQIVGTEPGGERWVTVQASTKDEAIRKVAQLGEVAGQARLVQVVTQALPSPQASPVRNEMYRLADQGQWAAVLSWAGLLVGPLAIVGWVMGSSVRRRSGGKYGGHAETVGIVMTILWAIGFGLICLAAIAGSH